MFSYLSLAIDEFLDIDLGDISKSLSDLYRKLSRLCGRFCRTRPAEGDAEPSRGLLPGLAPFSTSKLKTKHTHQSHRVGKTTHKITHCSGRRTLRTPKHPARRTITKLCTGGLESLRMIRNNYPDRKTINSGVFYSLRKLSIVMQILYSYPPRYKIRVPSVGNKPDAPTTIQINRHRHLF